MSSSNSINLEMVSQNPIESLRQLLSDLGARPFHQQVVQSPWSVIYDAEHLHKDVKGHITEVVDGCAQRDAIRCLTVIAPPGYGKTHLLAWNRQRLEQSRSAIFIYVPPYSPDSGPFENHVLRATLDTLCLHSPWQQQQLTEAVHSLLVSAYDGYIAAALPTSQLETGSFWSRLLRPLSLRIGGRNRADQLAALQRAFPYPNLFDFAFARFSEQHPPGPEGLRPDRDTFVAVAQLVCGNVAQQYHVRQWLQNEPMPPEVWGPYHIRQRCQGIDKVRNALFTLMHLVGRPFCIAFDQFEDTCNAISNHPAAPWDSLTQLLTRLSGVPRFSLLFFVQAAAWVGLSSKIPPMLLRRITEGAGAQRLTPLDDVAAQSLVRARMDAFVWKELAANGVVAPPDQPLFPFTKEEVRQHRIDANSEPGPFLRLLQSQYARRIAPPPPTKPTITAVEPSQVLPYAPTTVRLFGQHFGPDAKVFLAGKPIPVTTRDPEGTTEVLEITTPAGHFGDVEVRVQSSDDPNCFATTQLCFVDPVPTPYAQHVDRQKMRNRREELGLTQTQLGAQVGINQTRISQFERRKWDPSDEEVERIAHALGQTVVDFRLDDPGADT